MFSHASRRSWTWGRRQAPIVCWQMEQRIKVMDRVAVMSYADLFVTKEGDLNDGVFIRALTNSDPYLQNALLGACLLFTPAFHQI